MSRTEQLPQAASATPPAARGTEPSSGAADAAATGRILVPAMRREGYNEGYAGAIIAAGAMRAILELGGVKDVVGKSLGSRNPINITYATMEALRQLRDPDIELARRLGRPLPSEAKKVETVPVGENPDPAQPSSTQLESSAAIETMMSQRPGETLEGA